MPLLTRESFSSACLFKKAISLFLKLLSINSGLKFICITPPFFAIALICSSFKLRRCGARVYTELCEAIMGFVCQTNYIPESLVTHVAHIYDHSQLVHSLYDFSAKICESFVCQV